MCMVNSDPDPVTNESQLLRAFWAFGPSLEGFKYCRPVLSLDATFLYGKYKGKLLIALGVDGNGQIFPLAFGLAKEESKSDIGWFLRKLRQAIGQRANLCLITDRGKGIIAAVNEPQNGWAHPYATHRFCLRHIRTNYNSKFHNKTLKNMIYGIGEEVEIRKFEAGMEELKKLHKPSWEWCMKIPKEMWSLAYDDGHRFGSCTTNLVECFNGVLVSGRNLPVCAMVQLIFHRLVGYFVDKRNIHNRMRSTNSHCLTDRGKLLLDKARAHSMHLIIGQVFCRTNGIGTVVSCNGNGHEVRLSTQHCGCGRWKQFKVPCGHAIKMCMELKLDCINFIHPLYKLDAYRQTYLPQFQPLPHHDYWPAYVGPKIVPQTGTLRGKGRPQSTRFRMEMDERMSHQSKRCSRCRVEGHTITTCKTPATSIASSSRT